MAFASALFTELCSSPSLVIAAVLPAELLKFRNTSGRNRGNGNLEGYCSLKGVGVQDGPHNLFPSQSEADDLPQCCLSYAGGFKLSSGVPVILEDS